MSISALRQHVAPSSLAPLGPVPAVLPVQNRGRQPGTLICTATVVQVEQIGATFRRIVFGAAELRDFGTDDGRYFDQRIKLIIPGANGVLPTPGPTFTWSQWRSILPERRGVMRSYSVRKVTQRSGLGLVAVDFVVRPGEVGPATRWAGQAAPGDQVLLAGPRRNCFSGGIDFRPPAQVPVILAADETALPAAARILADLPERSAGCAFLEVPTAGDVLDLPRPIGVDLVWLPRGRRERGAALISSVVAHCGRSRRSDQPADQSPTWRPWLTEVLAAEEVWETPTFSSSGEELIEAADPAEIYVWAAGEAGVVAQLRAQLRERTGLRRCEGAFMGYWRRGLAMRS